MVVTNCNHLGHIERVYLFLRYFNYTAFKPKTRTSPAYINTVGRQNSWCSNKIKKNKIQQQNKSFIGPVSFMFNLGNGSIMLNDCNC